MKNSINKKAGNGINRRDLFKTGLVLAGGALLPSACTTSAGSVAGKSNSSKQQVTTRRKLGGTLEVSSIGLGVQNMPRTYQTTIPAGGKVVRSSTCSSTTRLSLACPGKTRPSSNLPQLLRTRKCRPNTMPRIRQHSSGWSPAVRNYVRFPMTTSPTAAARLAAFRQSSTSRIDAAERTTLP